MDKITYSTLSSVDKKNLFKALYEVDQETGAHDPRSSEEDLWNWNYLDLPNGESITSVANQGNKVVGYYHLPIFEAKINNKTCKLGHVQSVGVLSEYRKNKVFQQLAQFANLEADKKTDILYAFPNDNSIHTFIKYCNFEFVSELPMYVLPIKSKNLISSIIPLPWLSHFMGFLIDSLFSIFKSKLSKDYKIVRLDDIDQETENLFLNFGTKYDVATLRNKSFLSWRYGDQRKGNYHFFGLKKNNYLVAAVVIKEEEFLSNKGLIIMDLAFNSSEDLMALLVNLDRNHFDNDNSFILLSGNFNHMKDCFKSGFVKVPSFLVPRKLNFLVRWINSSSRKNNTNLSSYLVTLGDWDVF